MMSGNNPNKNAPQHAAHFFAEWVLEPINQDV